MLRETFEEFGIIPIDYELRGILDYNEIYKGERCIIRTHIYTATKYKGVPTESDEMMPIKVNKFNIPYDQMFGDDILWYNQLLEGKNFTGEIYFDDEFNIISDNIKFFEHSIHPFNL